MTSRDFTQVPNALFAAEVSANARWAYVALLSFHRPGKDTYPGVLALAERAGMSKRTLERAVSELRDAGMITITKMTYRRASLSNPHKFVKVTRNVYAFPELSAILAHGFYQSGGRLHTNVADGFDKSGGRLREQEDDIEEDELEEESPRRASAHRLTPLPADFSLTTEEQKELHEQFPKLDVANELAKFRDWAKSKDARFKDWAAAFRTWLRRADEYVSTSPGTITAAAAAAKRAKEDAEGRRIAKEFYESEGIEYP
ncbi:hypothetical protein ACSVHC_18080 [Arthrobacter sp. KNU-44]|uniref:hypothetical protein n=1 Tax=Arthrobacter sp. KNU-44 TaxID=3450744 RepID=UPI003F42488E